jgi:hypothetical protein
VRADAAKAVVSMPDSVASRRVCALGPRQEQTKNPLRETPIDSDCTRTGQTARCLANRAKLTSIPARNRPSHLQDVPLHRKAGHLARYHRPHGTPRPGTARDRILPRPQRVDPIAQLPGDSLNRDAALFDQPDRLSLVPGALRSPARSTLPVEL